MVGKSQMRQRIRAWEKELLEKTGQRLSQFGFSPRARGQAFPLPIDGGRAAVHLSFIEHEADVDVTIDVAVRFDAVEDLVNSFCTLLSQAEKAQTYTLGAELGNLEGEGQFRLSITSRSDIEPVAERLVAKVERVGLPYIERYSQPEVAYSVLSKDEPEVWIHSPFHDARAKRACAFLVILNRWSELPSLAARKRAFLESVGDPGIAAFDRFLANLEAS